MTLYIVRRVLISIPLLLVASFLSFALTTKMGNPLSEWKLSQPRSPAQIAAAEQRIGLDKPFLQRYGDWAVNFVQGDWGTTNAREMRLFGGFSGACSDLLVVYGAWFRFGGMLVARRFGRGAPGSTARGGLAGRGVR